MQRQKDGVVTTYVYDAFGNLAAEYGGTAQATGVQYLSADVLGSTRLVMGTAQVERHDYEPFGVGLIPPAGWRVTAGGYDQDTVGHKFTGEELDPESGFYYLRARHYSPVQGRFVSPDPDNAGASLGDPQSWNGYGYVGNNPLTYTDPSGECFWCMVGGAILDAVGILTGQPELIAWGKFIMGAGGADSVISRITTGANDGPWNEQMPTGVAGTGGMYGSGNTGPFIFSWEHPEEQGWGWLGLAPQIFGQVHKNTWPIAKPVCSGGGFGYVGPHFGIPKTPLQGEALFIPVDYESGKGFSTGGLVELGVKKSPFSVGGEVSRSWSTGKWSAGGLGFGNKEWKSAKVGPLSVGVLADTHGNVGAYAGAWAGGGVYFRPSFINGCR